MRVQPGQSRSGQAGSESCHSPGDWWVRSVDSEKASRVGQLRYRFALWDADALSLAVGSIGTVAMRDRRTSRRSPQPGASLQRDSPGTWETSPFPLAISQARVRLVNVNRASGGSDGAGPRSEENHRRRRYRAPRETRGVPGRFRREESYELIIPVKVGNWPMLPGPTGGKG